jgi:release factor glutamine methyltransferase
MASTKVAAVALPDLSHLSSADYERVYEPSDDTFLLVDALSADVAELLGRRPALCVEIGSGSGCVITHLGRLLPDAALLAGDVNRHANRATAATGAANGRRVVPVQMDLLSALRPGIVDVLVFNPPYVPTSTEELVEAVATADISAAWAGGPRGRLVLDRLLPALGPALSPSGLFYLLGVAENEPSEIASLLREQAGLESVVIAERRAQNERLFVMRCRRGGATEAPPSPRRDGDRSGELATAAESIAREDAASCSSVG